MCSLPKSLHKNTNLSFSLGGDYRYLTIVILLDKFISSHSPMNQIQILNRNPLRRIPGPEPQIDLLSLTSQQHLLLKS